MWPTKNTKIKEKYQTFIKMCYPHSKHLFAEKKYGGVKLFSCFFRCYVQKENMKHVCLFPPKEQNSSSNIQPHVKGITEQELPSLLEGYLFLQHLILPIFHTEQFIFGFVVYELWILYYTTLFFVTSDWVKGSRMSVGVMRGIRGKKVGKIRPLRDALLLALICYFIVLEVSAEWLSKK